MAKCTECGREISGFSFGKQKSICKWCAQHERVKRGELPEDDLQPVMAKPWERSATDTVFFTRLFILMNVLVYVAMCLSGVSPIEPTSPDLIRWGANYGPYTLGAQPWRLISCVFVHIGIIHIALNMWCLWKLGELAEKLYGHVTFLLVYLITGIAASAASVWWHPGGVSAGASGAIFGIAGALISSYYLGDFSLPQSVVKASLKSVVSFAGYNLVIGAMAGFVDNAAHVGGLVGGLLLGAAIAKTTSGEEGSSKRIVICTLGLLFALLPFWYLRSKSSFEVHMLRAQEAFGQNNLDVAVSELQEALKARPNDGFARYYLGHCLYEKNDFDRAEIELRKSLAIAPENENAAYDLGALLYQKKEIARAKEIFVSLAMRNPKNAYAHYGVGLVAEQENQPQLAVAEYSKAVELNPQLTGAYFAIGTAQYKLKRFDEAIESFNRAKQYAGDDFFIESGLADSYKAKGMSDEANAASSRAAQMKPAGN